MRLINRDPREFLLSLLTDSKYNSGVKEAYDLKKVTDNLFQLINLTRYILFEGIDRCIHRLAELARFAKSLILRHEASGLSKLVYKDSLDLCPFQHVLGNGVDKVIVFSTGG